MLSDVLDVYCLVKKIDKRGIIHYQSISHIINDAGLCMDMTDREISMRELIESCEDFLVKKGVLEQDEHSKTPNEIKVMEMYTRFFEKKSIY